MSSPLVIGHRGASGHRPEHTVAAYRLAWRSGADSVEPDVVCTRDGVLVCRHDLDLGRTTDIGSRPEFAHRRRRMVVEGREEHGWFVQDFDLAELRQLRARERWPHKRRRSARYDGQFGVLTLEELLDLREQETARAGRQLGVHVELKHPQLFASLGMPLHEPLVELLRTRGLTSVGSSAVVMSFDPHVLRSVRRRVDTRLVRLVGADEPVKRRRLDKISAYADAVGLHKRHLEARGRGGAAAGAATGRVKGPGKVMDKVVGAGLDALVWTLREEDHAGVGAFYDLGVAGVITDYPKVACTVRAQLVGAVAS
jgi:glycerophosphoryl diester phosphodiesterase